MTKHKAGRFDSMLAVAESIDNEDESIFEANDTEAVHKLFRSGAIRQKLMEVSLEKITPSPDQIRKHFDPVMLEELQKNIRLLGLIVPMAVERTDDHKFKLVDGERRYRAIQNLVQSGDTGKLNPKKIPVIVCMDNEDGDHMRHMIGMIANSVREDNTEADKARMIFNLCNAYKVDRQTVCEYLSLNKTVVSKYCRVGEMLDEKSLSAASKAKIPIDGLYELAKESEKLNEEKRDLILYQTIIRNEGKKPTKAEWIKIARRMAGSVVSHETTPRPEIIKIGKAKVSWKETSRGVSASIAGIDKKTVENIIDLIRRVKQ